MTTTAYLRVSTDQQDYDSQREQITAFAAAQNIAVDIWATDQASGAKPWQEREIGNILRTAMPGDTVIVSEVSRIARSVVGVLTALQLAAERGARVMAARNRLVMDDSLPAKITITVLALAAEIERDLIRERTRAALQARRAKGLPLGRPTGEAETHQLDARKEEIIRALDARISKRGIARMLQVAPNTLYDYLRRIGRHNDQDGEQPADEPPTKRG